MKRTIRPGAQPRRRQAKRVARESRDGGTEALRGDERSHDETTARVEALIALVDDAERKHPGVIDQTARVIFNRLAGLLDGMPIPLVQFFLAVISTSLEDSDVGRLAVAYLREAGKLKSALVDTRMVQPDKGASA